MSDTIVAIMQPYFFPYAGYFRLLTAADHFVVLDSVQFPRRGRVHRTRVPGPVGAPEWLTLPLVHAARNTLIQDMMFTDDARTSFDQRLRRLPWLSAAKGPCADRLRTFLASPLQGALVDFLVRGLELVNDLLGIQVPLTRSSDLQVDSEMSGQNRIIAIAKAVGARRYLNLPGGRGLYQPEPFSAAGLELAFLPDYAGPYRHFLPALATEDPADLLEDILDF